jgi:hypothetical protein
MKKFTTEDTEITERSTSGFASGDYLVTVLCLFARSLSLCLFSVFSVISVVKFSVISVFSVVKASTDD